MRPERTAIARISCASWVPTSDIVFPSIIRNICLCRESKKCAVWQTSDKVLETSVSAMLHNLFSDSERERKCCTAHRTREVPSVIRTTPFIRNTRDGPNKTPLFSNLCVCQISNTNTIHLLPNVSKVGLDELLCDVFDVTVPPRCTPCATLPSHGDAVSQLRPPFDTAQSQIRIFANCLVCRCFHHKNCYGENPRFRCKSL